MGVRNYSIEGVSGPGKTSVCVELRRRGLHVINGDTDLAYQGGPKTAVGDGVECVAVVLRVALLSPAVAGRSVSEES